MQIFSCLTRFPLVLAVVLFVPTKVLATGPDLSVFELDTDHLIAGEEFRLKYLSAEESITVREVLLSPSCSSEEPAREYALVPQNYRWRIIDDQIYLVLRIPAREVLAKKLRNELQGACIAVSYAIEGEERPRETFNLVVASKRIALLVALGFLFILFVAIWTLKADPFKPVEGFLKDESKNQWRSNTNPLERVLKFPLAFAITPMRTYSISLMQALFWTYLTVFMSVYIYWLYGKLLDLSPQILIMLGVGGGTAVASKVNALSRVQSIPAKYLELVTPTRERIPRLSDMISTGGRPNLFKFQIFAFTLIAGAFVLLETIKSYAIPQIPDSLVTLMGISSVVYLGNEVSADSLWGKVKGLIEKIEKYAEDNNMNFSTAEDIKAVGALIPATLAELEAALKALYR